MDTAVQADGFKASTKDAKCRENCWKVVMMVMGSKDEARDFHFVRQDDDGTWSHKQGHGPVKNTDDNEKKITDPEKAKIDDYNICDCYCVCPDVTVASVVPVYVGEVFATLTLKHPAVLSTRSLDLDIPPGRFTILRGEPKMSKPSVHATVLIYSGESDPTWQLGTEEIDVLRAKLRNLKPTDRRPSHPAGYQGFLIYNDLVEDIPMQVSVAERTLSVWTKEGSAQWFEDSNNLEDWLLSAICDQAFADEVRRVVERTGHPDPGAAPEKPKR